jgi:hypothetical protein
MSYLSEKTSENKGKSGRFVKFGENETLNGELNEKELELIQGGALTPEQAAEVKRLAKESGEHHGVNAVATITAYTIGTVTDFGANALGELAGEKVKKKRQH